jgi:hypothetical protein
MLRLSAPCSHERERRTSPAHVVVCAQGSGLAVITSDPLDLRRLDAKLRIISV